MESDGFTGHLDEISQFLKPENNAWLSPTGEGQKRLEEVPYWLRGYGDLGYVLRRQANHRHCEEVDRRDHG